MFEQLLTRALKQKGRTDVIVESAGALRETDGMEAESGAVVALRNIGIDISKHRSRWIGRLDLSKYYRIYCLDPAVVPAVEHHLLGHPFGFPNSTIRLVNENEGGIPNPICKGQEVYDEVLRIIDREIQNTIDDIFN
jgi:protein-tyrosine-phosphatase